MRIFKSILEAINSGLDSISLALSCIGVSVFMFFKSMRKSTQISTTNYWVNEYDQLTQLYDDQRNIDFNYINDLYTDRRRNYIDLNDFNDFNYNYINRQPKYKWKLKNCYIIKTDKYKINFKGKKEKRILGLPEMNIIPTPGFSSTKTKYIIPVGSIDSASQRAALQATINQYNEVLNLDNITSRTHITNKYAINMSKEYWLARRELQDKFIKNYWTPDQL